MLETPTPNLLKPEGLPPDTGGPRPASATRYVIMGIIALVAVNVIVRLLAGPPIAPPPYSAAVLQPKKFSLFQTVKSLLFRPAITLAGANDDRVNILLLGMGGPGHEGPFLTDTNIIISLKPSTRQVALISIPRDLGVPIGQYGWRKINNANAFGELEQPGEGGEYARQVFEKTFGLAIPYYVRLDFTAFEEIINAVGGISVTVPRAFTDPLFPGPNYSYQTTSFSAGAQIMNGERALQYARSRHGNNGEGSDFARAERQQLVIMALKQKILSFETYANPLVIQRIVNTLSTHLTTNLDTNQIVYLSGLAKDLPAPPISLVLDSSPNGYLVNTTGESGAFLLQPKTGSFAAINSAFTRVFDSATSSSSSLPPSSITTLAFMASSTGLVEIQNGTWQAGLASRVKERLEAKGIGILTIGNALRRPMTITTVFVLDPANTTIAKQVGQLIQAPISAVLPAWLDVNFDNPNTPEDERGMKYHNEAKVVVVLGEDYKE